MYETIFRIYRISGIQILHKYCAAMRIKILYIRSMLSETELVIAESKLVDIQFCLIILNMTPTRRISDDVTHSRDRSDPPNYSGVETSGQRKKEREPHQFIQIFLELFSLLFLQFLI